MMNDDIEAMTIEELCKEIDYLVERLHACRKRLRELYNVTSKEINNVKEEERKDLL